MHKKDFKASIKEKILIDFSHEHCEAGIFFVPPEILVDMVT